MSSTCKRAARLPARPHTSLAHHCLGCIWGWFVALCSVYDRVYETFVQALDGHDNGVNQYPPVSPPPPHNPHTTPLLHTVPHPSARVCGVQDIAPAYVVSTDLPSRVSRLNPAWNEENVSDSELMKRFERAMELTGSEFVDNVMGCVKIWLPARNVVKVSLCAFCVVALVIAKAKPLAWRDPPFQVSLEAREKAHPSGQIMVHSPTASVRHTYTRPFSACRLLQFRCCLNTPLGNRTCTSSKRSRKSTPPKLCCTWYSASPLPSTLSVRV